jgi:hypothetical protein
MARARLTCRHDGGFQCAELGKVDYNAFCL